MDKTPMAGTEDLMTVSEFAKAKNIYRQYIYAFIEVGLVTPVYIGRFNNIYINAVECDNVRFRSLGKKEKKELKAANNIN